MTSFVVLQHNDEPSAKPLEKTIFVRDAFSVVALAFPIFWLFWHRLWLLGIAALLLFIFVSIFSVQNIDYFWLLIAFNTVLPLAVALEGSAWRMSALRLIGYKDIAVVDAENLDQAQLKWALRKNAGQIAKSTPKQEPQMIPVQDDLIFGANGQN